jgi:type II protein arginine methyltransferase
MLTTPISTPHFHSQVLTLMSSHLSLLETSPVDMPAPLIPPFNSVDTPLTPGDTVSQLIGYVSPWIDLCSPDPLIANISRQVLTMEIAYAAFCGVGNVIVQGPRTYSNGRDDTSGLIQYARAVQEALGIGNYVQIAIHLPMYDQGESPIKEPIGDLAPFVREGFNSEESRTVRDVDLYSTWDAWNMVRSVCQYNSRLSLGKRSSMKLHAFPFSMPKTSNVPVLELRLSGASFSSLKVPFPLSRESSLLDIHG